MSRGDGREGKLMDQQIVIGIDGGGTKVRAAITRVDGQLMGQGESGTGNYHDVGADIVRANIGEAVSQAWTATGQPPRQADAIFLGLGSIVTQEDREVIRRIVRELGIVNDGRIGVDHDLRVALAGGLAGQPGIVLIAGTGSSCYGRNENGQNWRAGGWGPILDDPGSSYWLGRQAMIAAIRDYDGRGSKTRLHQSVIEAVGINSVQEIMLRVELEGMARSEIAALAPLVTSAAAEGDDVACSLIERGADQLALMVATVAERIAFAATTDKIPVIITGGLTSAGSVFLSPLHRAIQRRAPATCIVDARMAPVLGGVLLALELAQTPISPQVIAQLSASNLSSREASVA